ncbi:MAG TPA: methyltransferase domain-containing protein [Williamwhitmania sp.]|nr:methyltransferase domain-containing protein [Williamwhitmania sp.]
MNQWDARYSTEEYVYGTEPNHFFSECLRSLKQGKLLLPGEGEGRNAAWAAQLKWQVDAFDQSTTGQEKAFRLAKDRGVKFNYQIMSVEDFGAKPNTYDAAAIIFLHLPQPLRSKFHRAVAESIKPGGHIIIDAFSQKQIDFNSGGPRDIEQLYSKDSILGDFPDFDFEICREEETILREGNFHTGKASVLRFFGAKV